MRAAGGVLTPKQALHRPGTAPAHGLRAGPGRTGSGICVLRPFHSPSQRGPESRSGALFQRMFSASPQRWPNPLEAAPQIQDRVSMPSRSGKVAYGTKCVLDPRTNRERISLGPYRGEDGSSHESGCRARARIVENGEISAHNSSQRVGTSPKRGKKARRALRCRGDWIRTSDLLNPIEPGLPLTNDR
jgi:hypothetical protein